MSTSLLGREKVLSLTTAIKAAQVQALWKIRFTHVFSDAQQRFNIVLPRLHLGRGGK